jgi:oligopeptide/dipeptide ABC transporter ATP-binding protein
VTSPILAVRQAAVRYPGTAQPAVTECNLSIDRGDALGIVGESGSGKTTLGRLLVGLLTPTEGQALVEGRPWSEVRRRDNLRRRVQMIFQDPYASLNPGLSARDTVAEVFRVWEHATQDEAASRAGQLLHEVGLSADSHDRRSGSLSGGQCQRVGIARALACSPDVLVADEPTSSLDVSVQAQILNLLKELRQSRELTLVLISHDLAVVRYVTDNAMVMYHGRVVEQGATHRLLDSPAHPYTRALIDSIPGLQSPGRFANNDVPMSGCAFAPRCPGMGRGCIDSAPPLPLSKDAAACYYPLERVHSPVLALDHPGVDRTS